MSDGSYGMFDIGIGNNPAPQSNGDSMEPLLENDISPLAENIEMEIGFANLRENPTNTLNDRSVEHTDTTELMGNLRVGEPPINNTENRGQTPDSTAVRPLNIERNINYAERNPQRSYDNTRQNVNLNSGDHKYEREATGLNPPATWTGGKPVPPQNVFNDRPTENTAVKAPPQPQLTTAGDQPRCPICSITFSSDLPEAARTRHVYECLQKNDDNADLTMTPATPDNDRTCPMCQMVFDDEITDREVQRHVDDHFQDHSIEPPFEMINHHWR